MKTKTRKFIASLLLFFSFGDISHVIAIDYVIDFSVPTDYTSSNATQAYVNNSLAQLSEQLSHTGKINNSTTYNGAYDVIVDGNYAYMTNYLRDSVSILNISDPANPSLVIEIVNNGGTIRLDGAAGIVKEGNYLYVASNLSDALQIINVSNPASPTAAGQILNSTTLNGARGIAKSGNYVYVTCDAYDALQVINVSNPASPSMAGTYRDASNGNLNGARDIKISGNYAYIAAYDRDSLAVIDITSPTSPTLAGQLQDATNLNGAYNVEVSGNYAYVSAYLNASVRVIDISTPTAPVGIINISGGSYSLTNPRDLLIDGNKLFITSYGNDAVNIADISNPTSPVFVNKIIHNAGNPLLDGADGIFKVGNYIYITSYISDALEILEVSYPKAIQFQPLSHTGKINNSTTYNGAYDVIVDGNYAYMTNVRRDSVSIINISNKANPTLVKELRNNNGTIRLDGATGIVKEGDYLYVASNLSDALQIINVSNPANPTAAGQLRNTTTLDGARGIAKSGNYVYVTCDAYDALQVINVSNPASPSIAGTYRDASNGNLNGARDIKISGNYAYIAAYDRDSLAVIDITSPTSPTLVGQLQDATNLNGAYNVEVSGNYAYVSAYLNASVRVIDISTPTAPVGVINISGGSYSLTNPRDLLIDGNKLFITSYGSDAVNIADISNPKSPIFVNKIIHNANNPLLDGADGIFKVGNYIYIASYISDALEILEVSVPYQTVPYITTNTNTTYLGALYNMIEKVGANNAGNMKYQISKNGGVNYYYWNGSAWIIGNAGDYSQANDISTIQANILSFNSVISGNSFRLRAYLESDGSQKTELDDVTISSDNTAPIISSSSPSSDGILPKGDFTLSFNYSDNESGVDTNSSTISLQKWDGVGDWGGDIAPSYIDQLGVSITSSQANYPIHTLGYGKYRANFSIKDIVGNTINREVIFYVDEITWNISRPDIAINEAKAFTHSFSDDEITLTIQTVGAGFSLYLKNNTPPTNETGNMIEDWDGTKGFGYDLDPYTGSVQKINNSNIVLVSQNKNLNTNGEKNTYTYKIKLGAYTNYSHPSGNYNGELGFIFSSEYQ